MTRSILRYTKHRITQHPDTEATFEAMCLTCDWGQSLHRTTPPKDRRKSPEGAMRTTPGISPGAVAFVQVRGGFPLGISPGFPQHDAHDRPETAPNGPEADHGPPATEKGR